MIASQSPHAVSLSVRLRRAGAQPAEPGRRQAKLGRGAEGHADARWALVALRTLEQGQVEAVRDALDAWLSRPLPTPGADAPKGRGLWQAFKAVLGLFEGSEAAGVTMLAPVIWLSGAYASQTGDRAFLQRQQVALAAALATLAGQTHDGLLAPAPGPAALAANVLYHRALRAMGDMAVLRGDAVEAARHWADASVLRDRIHACFGDATRDGLVVRDLFTADAQALATHLGLAAEPAPGA